MIGPKRAKTLIAMVLALVLSIVNTLPGFAVKFSDISSHWARDSITRLAAQNIVTGLNGRFSPTTGVTRAEFTSMMIRALGLADQAEAVKGSATGYKDVPSSHWASGFVIIAREKGIITGYPDETFKPSSLIRRDEITSVLVRALDLSVSEDQHYLSKVFSDWETILGWASESIIIAHKYKLINGFPDGSFYPAKNATRGETAALIEKVLHQLGTEYTFYGKTQSVDPVSRTITVDINGQIETFSYVPQLQVKTDKGFTDIDNLEPGQGILLILDDQGNLVYVEEGAGLPEENMDTDSSMETRVLYSPPLDQQVITEDIAKSNSLPVIILAREGRTQELVKFIELNGGIITHVNIQNEFILASLNAAFIDSLKESPLVEEVTRDDMVKVEKLSASENGTAAVNSETDAGLSLNVTKQAINAPEFVKVSHSVGRNQIVAVLDTGIDPGHPDLQKTPGGKQKIIDWQDFTEEGDIHTIYKANRVGNKLELSGTEYYAAGLKSASGTFKYGYLREIDITDNNGKSGYDLNFNGTNNDVFAVIVVESSKVDVYDTIYVDTNANRDFTDEEPLKVFSGSFNYAGFSSSEGKDRLNFVLTRIDTDGTKINISFDGNDHGTHVAGIIAAHGNIKGVAPGAQLMALKVLNAEGKGSLGTITEAIAYAASHGAKIVNLSLGIPISETESDDDGASIPARLLNKLTEKYGTVFVLAAGNDGPGLGTVNTPGDADAAIMVGAYITPEMWKNDYGWDVPEDNLWFFSSVGPRKDGALSPSIVAPGSAVSTVPLRGGKQYFLSEGTSIAAPHVSGAVALLMEVVQRNNLKISPYVIKRAIELGAKPVPEYTAAEQGYGAVNLPISWAELVSLQENRMVSAKADSPGIHNGTGLMFREGSPRRVTVNMYNNSGKMQSLALAGSRWIKPAQSLVNIPPGKNRAVDIDLQVPEQKGVFSWFISGDDTKTYGKDLDVLTTVVNPYNLSEENNYSVRINDVEKPAQYKRYFFKVPAKADSIKAKITVPGKRGRAKIFLFDPKGRLAADSSSFAGVNAGGGGSDSVTVSEDSPIPGVWECVVYSSAGMSNFGIKSTEFNLDVSLAGVSAEEPEQKPRDVIVGILPKQLIAGNRDFLTVQVRERNSKKPFNGFIEIDGKLYYSRKGKVTIPVNPSGDSLSLVVKTVPGSSLVKPWEFDFTMFPG